jgi:MFS family permease
MPHVRRPMLARLAARLRPPVAFTPDQRRRVAVLCMVGAIANFGSVLFTQNGDAATTAFHRSDEALTIALALARIGVLVTLVAASFADRIGRRRMILICLGGVCVANALTAAAPSFEVFTAGQILTRAFANSALVITALAVVEEAPEGARAYAFSMLGLALGAGFGVSVLLLPINDLTDDSWRAAFVISAFTALLIPRLARNLQETRRFERLGPRARTSARRQLLEPFDRKYGGRFVLLGLLSFLANIFSAPSSQLTNRYLTRTHDFSNSQVALLRGATAGVPGFIGVLLAGRLAESRGRRAVIFFGLLIATAFQATFFLGSGVLLWLMPIGSVIAAACAGIGVGTTNSELFPTEARGASNGFLLVCGVAGAAIGLLLPGQLKDLVGGLGPAIALCGIAPLVAAFFVVPRLPETRARTLDEISPSEL